jgi:hypothetical protein
MTDGSVHNLLLKADDRDKSFLAGIIDIKEGRLNYPLRDEYPDYNVLLTDAHTISLMCTYAGSLVESLDSDSEVIAMHSLTRSHQLSEASLNNQAITSSCFLSHFAIVFGLSDGDIIYLRMASPEGGGQAVCVETVMRCAGVVQALWTGLVGGAPGAITPRVMVISGNPLQSVWLALLDYHVICFLYIYYKFCTGSHLRDSSIAVVYTADGCLRVWDCLSRTCLQKISVLELLGLTGQERGGVSVEGVHLFFLYARLDSATLVISIPFHC